MSEPFPRYYRPVGWKQSQLWELRAEESDTDNRSVWFGEIKTCIPPIELGAAVARGDWEQVKVPRRQKAKQK